LIKAFRISFIINIAAVCYPEMKIVDVYVLLIVDELAY
jgi:hypothetical protein